MANLLEDTPDPENATDDPSGFAVGAFMWMLTVGLVFGLYKAGKQIVGDPLANLIMNLKNMARNSAQEATEDSADFEVF